MTAEAGGCDSAAGAVLGKIRFALISANAHGRNAVRSRCTLGLRLVALSLLSERETLS